MKKLNEYREMDREISRIKKKMESIQSSDDFKNSLRFEEGLRKLMKDFDFTAKDVLETLGVVQAKRRGRLRLV